jgi:hypothetical protein
MRNKAQNRCKVCGGLWKRWRTSATLRLYGNLTEVHTDFGWEEQDFVAYDRKY